MMEIERKYAIKELPENLYEYQIKFIEQGYIEDESMFRIRKVRTESSEEYYLTIKKALISTNNGGACKESEYTIINEEIESNINKEEYEDKISKIKGNLIQKTRYIIPLSKDLVAELDIFEGKLKGLIYVEVEFDTEEQANKFKEPEWFGTNISSNKNLSNYNLSKLEKPPMI